MPGQIYCPHPRIPLKNHNIHIIMHKQNLRLFTFLFTSNFLFSPIYIYDNIFLSTYLFIFLYLSIFLLIFPLIFLYLSFSPLHSSSRLSRGKKAKMSNLLRRIFNGLNLNWWAFLNVQGRINKFRVKDPFKYYAINNKRQ